MDAADARHNSRGRDIAPLRIHAPSGPQPELQQRAPVVQQFAKSLAHGQAAKLPLATLARLAAPLPNRIFLGLDVPSEFQERCLQRNRHGLVRRRDHPIDR
jgi:hypothetical protein